VAAEGIPYNRPEEWRMHPVLDLSSSTEAAGAPGAAGREARPALRVRARQQLARCWQVVKIAVSICMKYRVTGLAAEAAFFALLSLPPLAIGLTGTLGYLNGVIGADKILQIKAHILSGASTVLSGPGLEKLDGLLTNLLTNGHPDLISIGFLLALWAGSRAMNVYVDTITIAYGLSGRRGIVRTRVLAFGLYMLGLVLGSVALPMLVIGPDLLLSALPSSAGFIHAMYWPLVLTVLVAFLNTLYHLAVPVRTPWSQDLPGTLVAVLLWLGGSALLRDYVSSTFAGTNSTDSLYGGLASAVAILVWLYVTAFATLLGAALNAAVEQVWPSRKLWLARLALRQRVAAQRDAPDSAARPEDMPEPARE
jgi:membrane protein